jgi:CheY-like chemotaxis protein
LFTFASSDSGQTPLAADRQRLTSADRQEQPKTIDRQHLELEDLLAVGNHLSSLVILVVEDNPADRYLIGASLNAEEPGCEIIVAEDGDAAVQYLAAQKPDLVILDLNLPRRSGLEVLRYIRAENRLEGLVVVIFSSSPKESVERDAPQADAHIQKPFELDLFLQVGKQAMQCLRQNQERSSQLNAT